MKGSQPETIKVENFNRDLSCLHPLQEGVDGFFVIVCSETGTQPQTITPTWDLSRFSCENGIFLQDFFWSRAMYNIPKNY
jgi:hypothetical protein